MEFNSQQDKIGLKINGIEYKISKPKMKDILFLSEKQKELSEKGDAERTLFLIEFLDKLGLPKDVSMDLEAELFLQIVEHVTQFGKKK